MSISNDKNERVGDILKCIFECLCENGLENTSIRDLSRWTKFVYGIMKLTQMVPKIDAAKSELSLL